MAAGAHTSAGAERQAARLPAFTAADPAHIDLFARATVRLWEEIEQTSLSGWSTKMVHAARAWSAHRSTLTLPRCNNNYPDGMAADATGALPGCFGPRAVRCTPRRW